MCPLNLVILLNAQLPPNSPSSMRVASPRLINDHQRHTAMKGFQLRGPTKVMCFNYTCATNLKPKEKSMNLLLLFFVYPER